MSSYKGLDLFGSGPHRCFVGRRGYVVTPNAFEPGGGMGSGIRDVRELDVWVRGRLVATSEAALWTLREAIANQFATPATAGTFVDTAGRTFENMTMVRYVEDEVRDKGRVWSVAYEVQLRRFGA
jgi:hypothetical protein